MTKVKLADDASHRIHMTATATTTTITTATATEITITTKQTLANNKVIYTTVMCRGSDDTKSKLGTDGRTVNGGKTNLQ